MKKIEKKCFHCSEPFWTTTDDKIPFCRRVTCQETAALLEVEKNLDRLVRAITPHIITTKTGRKNLKNKANFLINRNKNRYIPIKNLPRGPKGVTAKFDVVKQEVVYRTFKELSKTR
ncbi:hypothetical protein [Salegentibacter sp. F14]